jgi:hypothetical protein
MPSHKRFEITQNDRTIAQGVVFGYPAKGVAVSFTGKDQQTTYGTWDEFDDDFSQFQGFYGNLELDFIDDDGLSRDYQNSQTVA